MQAKGAPHLIAAAVLHDVGHLLHGLSEDIAAHDIDGRHEVVGEAWLRSRFGSIVSEPVRLHVDAKRYLCFKEPAYQAELSASSLLSLKFQGGPFSTEESHAFERNPYFRTRWP
jgi:[1-hydroxy-2-(trimethylamino)ethyl]phosphonate dioxygenase